MICNNLFQKEKKLHTIITFNKRCWCHIFESDNLHIWIFILNLW